MAAVATPGKCTRDTLITINQGKIHGIESRSVLSGKKYYSFLGIPYAKPPLGDLRFKPPQKPDSWDHIFIANVEGGDCIQSRMPLDITGSEDCLYLNVFTPVLNLSSGKRSTPKPVMVNVHGGGFYWFSSSPTNSSPDYLIDFNVVVVTFNYRLSVLGFMNLGIVDCPGNMGLKDQLMAFQWVKDNIEYFGGDPNNITVFGQSAGASSIHLHTMSPLSEGLFHKCIMQSGHALSPWGFQERPEDNAYQLAKMFDFKGTVEDKEEILQFLKNIPAEDLIVATRELKAFIRQTYPGICSAYPFLPSVETVQEDAFLTDHPMNIISEKKARKMPTIMGMVDREGGNMFIKEPLTYEIMRSQFEQVVKLNIPVRDEHSDTAADKIKRFYFGEKPLDEITVNEICDFYSDIYFKDFYYIIEQSLLNGNENENALYIYQFCYVGEMNNFKVLPDFEGVIHGAEHFYQFGSKFFHDNPFFSMSNDDTKTIKNFCQLWTNFAKSGNPNEPRAPSLKWESTTIDRRRYLKIDKTSEMLEGRINEERYKFWDTLAEYM